jgi:hypothetical protein
METEVSTYTVHVEASNPDRTVWQEFEPPETMDAVDEMTPADLAGWVAGLTRDVKRVHADGRTRVLVFAGPTADSEPVATVYLRADDGIVCALCWPESCSYEAR